MKALSGRALAAIARHDLEAFAAPEGVRIGNRARFYKWLVLRGRDVEIHTVAAKSRKDGTRCVKEVVRASVNGDTVAVKDMVLWTMSGYAVDWSAEKLGRRLSWSYHGRWGEEEYSARSHKWKLNCGVLNLELLKKSKRFRYCAYDYSCGDVLDYLKFYAAHPRIELLAKAGVGRFCLQTGFVKRLEANKGFMRFFSQHLEEIKKNGYRSDVILMAFKRGISMAEAKHHLVCARIFRNVKLPAGIDKTRAGEYVGRKRGINAWEYAEYIKNCQKLGLDLADTKVVYPKRFAAREKSVSEQLAVIDRKARAELSAKLSARLEKRIRKYLALERVKGPFSVRLPRTELEFEREEKWLKHCVWRMGYADKMARGECVVVFVRQADKPDQPFVTVELSASGKKVLQCYGASNSRPAEDVQKFVFGKMLSVLRKRAS